MPDAKRYGQCQRCGRFALLHFCGGCGKWICDSLSCRASSALAAGLKLIKGKP